MERINKAILVIDMPNSCDECLVRNSVGYGKWCAGFDDTYIDSYPTKPDWCPLKTAPKKIDVPDWDDNIKAKNKNAEEVGIYMYDRGHYRGYNICISNILGE